MMEGGLTISGGNGRGGRKKNRLSSILLTCGERYCTIIRLRLEWSVRSYSAFGQAVALRHL